MQKIIINQHGGPDVLALEEATSAPLADDEIRIKNSAIGVNFIDIYQREGLYPMDLPFTPGQEGIGFVSETGSAVANVQVGDRVAYLSGGSSYATETNVAATKCVKIPERVNDEDAAAVLLKGLTVQMLIRQVFDLKEGQTALVYAAAGGVGNLLCQWANHIGATVIGVVGNAAKVDIAKAAGATNVIDRSATPDLVSEVRLLTKGDGVDVVYDSIGDATFIQSLDCLALRGMMVTYGNASGPPPAIAPLELAKRGSLSLIRPILFHYSTPEHLPVMARELFDLMQAGILKASISEVFPLQEAAKAQALLEGGQTTGAIVLKP